MARRHCDCSRSNGEWWSDHYYFDPCEEESPCRCRDTDDENDCGEERPCACGDRDDGDDRNDGDRRGRRGDRDDRRRRRRCGCGGFYGGCGNYWYGGPRVKVISEYCNPFPSDVECM